MIELTMTFDGQGDPEALMLALQPLAPQIGSLAGDAGFTMRGVMAGRVGADRTIHGTGRAREAIAAWDKACESLVGEFDAGDQLAEVLGYILDQLEAQQ